MMMVMENEKKMNEKAILPLTIINWQWVVIVELVVYFCI